ncbi:uncharacterized protein LOC143911092 [Arctopsyche grandis]|uniref:uncharacterized protein LOC143911092 n=1 Tax=Arctopsyche grandis TaxID=121162 RepID=UPI00406D830B
MSSTNLTIEYARLQAREKWLEDLIAKIKHQKMSLEVEQLQINSMIRDSEKQQHIDSSDVTQESKPDTDKAPLKLEPCINVELLDQAKSSINTTTLDLTVVNNFNEMLQNHIYEETDDSENDEDI